MKRAGKEKKIIMKLYFGNTVTTVTTLMILALLGFIGYSVCNRAHITFWGRRSAVLLVFGLAVCCSSRRRGTGWTRPYSTPLTEAARRGCSRWSACRSSPAA